MTPQEEQLLEGLIQRVQQAKPANKDVAAEQMLQRELSNDPDALYVLAQTVLVQQYALEQAQKQLTAARGEMEQMKTRQAAAPEQHTSFLGSLFGSHAAAPPPIAAQQGQFTPVYGAGGSAQPGYGQQQPGYGQPQYVPQQYVPMQAQGGMFGGGGFGGGGFLQGAMQTAAGVAAGELAFRGIEDLMHGFGHASGYGSDRMMGGMEDRPEVVNNYYGGDGAGREVGGDSFGDRLQAADGGTGESADVEDRRSGFFGSDDSSSVTDDGGSGDGFADDGGGDSFGTDDGS